MVSKSLIKNTQSFFVTDIIASIHAPLHVTRKINTSQLTSPWHTHLSNTCSDRLITRLTVELQYHPEFLFAIGKTKLAPFFKYLIMRYQKYFSYLGILARVRLLRNFNVKIHVSNKNVQTWLLIGWQEAASQSEAMFENSCQMTWIFNIGMIGVCY